ncbi:winged helix DNA-binding domain-containing protein [Micromonosporaceae bacterium Da 78-11]
MDATTALSLRMTSLLLRGGGPASVAGVVEWFGAMQAQDVNSALWSLGARLPGSTVEDVNAALEDRQVLRTWPMRGTVHFVPAADARWMLEVMGVRALSGVEKRRQLLGLDEKTVDRATDLLGAALAGGGRLTRAECLAALTAGGVEVTGQRGYHLLWYASQRGVSAIAPHIGKEQTFVLLDEWAPAPNRPSRDEALGIIALRYFRSHGPTTRKDFAGWTGLTMGDCKTGIAVAGDALTAVDVDGVEMIVAPAVLDAPPAQPGAWLALPGFDEYMLGFKDRSMMIDAGHLQVIVPGGNGMFRATVVRDGRAVAVWTRAITRKGVTVTVEPLIPLTASDRVATVEALEPYAAYLGLPLTVNNP